MDETSRKNNTEGVSYSDIEKEIPNKPWNTGTLIKALRKDNLIEVVIINNGRRGTRKRFKLNAFGQELTDSIIKGGLTEEEVKIFNFLKESKHFHSRKLIRDFWDVIDLFYEYGFNKNASLLSEFLRNLIKQIRRFIPNDSEPNPISINKEHKLY